MRASNRENNQLREISFSRNFTKHAEGSVLVSYGDTRVLCNASVVSGVPRFLKGKGQGWLTAEYSMLPRATHERVNRENYKSGPSGRTLEIQRLIGRSLRSAVDLKQIGENTITLDCDVLQADGGTRTASITGACVALHDALNTMMKNKKIKTNPLKYLLASVSVGVYQGTPVVDLDYAEDSSADTDMNVVINEHGQFIEIQGTAEANPFSAQDLQGMLQLAESGIAELISKQRIALAV